MIRPSLLSPLLALLLASCGGLMLPGKRTTPAKPTIVYALGEKAGFHSPLLDGPLQPACPALEFPSSTYLPSDAHRKLLEGIAATWPSEKPRYLIAGYSQPGLPEDYARSLSERRAQAVRQLLIECGIDASHVQTVGFGHDSAPRANVVFIYPQ
jgi:hypothetical protein